MTSISGADFDVAWAERLIVNLEGLSVSVIGIRQLYANKLASGRVKDQQDAAMLKEVLEKSE